MMSKSVARKERHISKAISSKSEGINLMHKGRVTRVATFARDSEGNNDNKKGNDNHAKAGYVGRRLRHLAKCKMCNFQALEGS
jgi:hypothetical protein